MNHSGKQSQKEITKKWPQRLGRDGVMKEAFGEIFLWNKNMDRLKRVLQRLEAAAVWSKKEMKAYEVKLEEIRAGLNADFAEAMAKSERDEHARLQRQRMAWERRDVN